MYKLVALSIVIVICTNSRSLSQVQYGYYPLYVIIQLDSDRYMIDMSFSSQFRITTSYSKQRYQDYLKKESESKFLVGSSADFDPRPFYIFNHLTRSETTLNKKEFLNFKSENKIRVIEFTAFEDSLKIGFKMDYKQIFILNYENEKYEFYTIYD